MRDKGSLLKSLAESLLYGGFLLLVLSAAPGCRYGSQIHQSQPYAQRFVNALAAHQFAQAESMVSFSKRKQLSANYFALRWRQMEQVIGKPLSIKWTKASYSVQINGFALTRKGIEYTYQVTGVHGRQAEIIFLMVRKGNHWLVEDVRIVY